MSKVYIDIETLPTNDPLAITNIEAGLKHPSNWKDPVKIRNWYEEKTEEIVAKTSLNALYGRVGVACFAVDDRPVIDVIMDEDEKTGLNLLWSAMERELNDHGSATIHWVAFNHKFDLPFLWRRSKVHRVTTHPLFPVPSKQPYHQNVIDPMALWAGYRDYVSARDLNFALGVPMDDDEISGADVADAYEEGRLDDIVKHCRADVERLRAVEQILSSNTFRPIDRIPGGLS